MKIPIEIYHVNKDIRRLSLIDKGIKRIEELGYNHYKKRKFKVYRTYLKAGQESLIGDIKNNKITLNISKKKLIETIKQIGRFDLFCYKTKKNWFYAEVKKIPNDKPQYHENQMGWIRKYHSLLKNNLRFIFIVPKHYYIKQ